MRFVTRIDGSRHDRRSGASIALGFTLLTSMGCGGTESATTGNADGQDAGMAPVAVEPDASSASCVSVTGAGLEPWLDLSIAGSRFDAYEGRRIRMVVSGDVSGRLGVADETVTNGAFEVTFPGTINYSYYTEIAFYVDNDVDDTCDVGEPTWGFVTGSVQENLVVDTTPDGPCLSGGGPSVGTGCHTWLPSAGDCFVNGQADLQMNLPCPAP